MFDNIFGRKEVENKIEDIGERWVWVDGYKGTDKDMKCHNEYQFAINKQFDMPEDAEIKECNSGFHLCRDLKDVFSFYNVKKNNRFFEVRALVRLEDYEKYGTVSPCAWPSTNNKLVAKSIQFLRELTVDEILSAHPEMNEGELDSWSDDVKKVAIESSIQHAREIIRLQELVELGYSAVFATFVINEGGYELAKAVGSQPDLSMDVRAMFIFQGLTVRHRNRDAISNISNSAMNAINACYGTMANPLSTRR